MGLLSWWLLSNFCHASAFGEGIVYSTLDPALIVKKIWPKDKKYVDLKSVWESFLRFYGLPLPEEESVIIETIKEGVKLGEFGLARGNPENEEFPILLYREVPTKVDLTEDWYLITRELAEQEKVKKLEEQLPVLGEPTKEIEEKKEPPTKVEERPSGPTIKKYERLQLKSEIPWEKLSEFEEGVISPLVRIADNVKLTIDLEAESEEGIDENTLEIPIKETLRQIKAKILEMKTRERKES